MDSHTPHKPKTRSFVVQQRSHRQRAKSRWRWALMLACNRALRTLRHDFRVARKSQAVDHTRLAMYDLDDTGRFRSRLSLQKRFITRKELALIAEVLDVTGEELRVLDLSRNPLGKESASILARIITTCPGLKHVNLSWTMLGDKGIKKLCRRLSKEGKEPTCLVSLTLVGNGITDVGARALLDLRSKLRTLREIRLEKRGSVRPIVGSTVSAWRGLSSSEEAKAAKVLGRVVAIDAKDGRVLVEPLEGTVTEEFWTSQNNAEVRYNYCSEEMLGKLFVFSTASYSWRRQSSRSSRSSRSNSAR